LYLGAAVAHRALDDLDRAPNGLFIGKSRWFPELIEQCILLGLPRRPLGRLLRGFSSFFMKSCAVGSNSSGLVAMSAPFRKLRIAGGRF
jgi:hypothetical protein